VAEFLPRGSEHCHWLQVTGLYSRYLERREEWWGGPPKSRGSEKFSLSFPRHEDDLDRWRWSSIQSILEAESRT
jgi:hypothetical protein